MKYLVIFVFILNICSESFAAEYSGIFKDPAYPGKCVYENLVLAAGEEAKLPQECGVIFCENDSFATVQTCGVMIPPSGCKFTDFININDPYPECCEKKLVCY
ncbi:uncharacterized protein LOC135949048 [Calliphora vicina]|uniref:uncharacterized protein LOC135949048 n=1 Tax=Calliphora vicina TaxID=7373 RepID=UPI00325A9564